MSKKFDIVITNPPYDKNLHLKILGKVIPHCEETINISPDSFIVDPFIKFDKSKEKQRIRKEVLSKLAEFVHYDHDETNALFGTNSMVTVGIQKYTQTGGFDYSQYEESNKLVLKIMDKVSKLPSLRSRFTKKEEAKKFYVPIRRRTHDGVYDWYSENSGATEGVSFDTKEEKDNFIDSLQKWPYKYLVAIGRGDNSALNPIMNDYTHPWDNKRFCDYFNITGYISDTEAEPDSEWEEILNTMEKYK